MRWLDFHPRVKHHISSFRSRSVHSIQLAPSSHADRQAPRQPQVRVVIINFQFTVQALGSVRGSLYRGTLSSSLARRLSIPQHTYRLALICLPRRRRNPIPTRMGISDGSRARSETSYLVTLCLASQPKRIATCCTRTMDVPG